ncbi:Nuclear distribution protein nudE-like 1-A [Gossypium arboreum]|uniref:Nuclear distribution protein nudE-like 1-A n=1 Tax=Gossypium arboreum TaxID=29729 RepID=A0A0B0NKP6_GOSAR|nr:Nuclear distribution protein nudE-like 1-A [Gossypium arboreum]
MADSEKLTALKKAYAEIILNTAKEAAARIMVSERKALRYQQELFAAKYEALHMLLRLKQMLDAKVNEAEMMSLNQQKRIEELEAQLGEAEDIVRDLRAELREVQDELEKLTKNSMQCSSEQKSGQDFAASDEMSNVKTISDFGSVRSSLLDAQTDIVTVSAIKSSCPSGTNVGIKCSCKDNCYVCNPDFASIVMRRKEPDLYRNGCTQRIRALERCLLNENKVDDAKNENAGEDDERKDMCSKSSLRTDNGRLEERMNEFETMQNDVIATRQESDQLCAESFSHAADENAQFGEDSRIINHDALKGSQSPPIPSSPPNAVKAVTESGYEKVDNDENNDKLLVDKKESTRLDGGLVENLGDAFCKPDLEMVDVSAVNSDVKVSEGSSTQLVNNKFLMYTRKRKKDPLSSPDRDFSLDNDNSKRKTEDKQNGSLDSEKSTLTTESSRDSRRLAQVARQLISLSEKKWR